MFVANIYTTNTLITVDGIELHDKKTVRMCSNWEQTVHWDQSWHASQFQLNGTMSLPYRVLYSWVILLRLNACVECVVSRAMAGIWH